MEDPPAPTLVGCQALEQFLLLAKTAKGPAVAQLIKHATEANGVYVFGELLECECVEQIRNGPHADSVKLLEIFAYSTYEDYKSKIGRSNEMHGDHFFLSSRRSSLPPSSLPYSNHKVKAPHHCNISCPVSSKYTLL